MSPAFALAKRSGFANANAAAAERQVTVVPRRNDNGARSKSRQSRTIPVSEELVWLWADYLHAEYGDIDSDYVFVNLFAEPRGRAMSYAAVYDLVLRLRRRTGVDFDPHWCRHTMATRLQMSRIASGASFDKIREQALPATSPFGLDQGRLAEGWSHVS